MNIVAGFLGVFALAALAFVGGTISPEPSTVPAVDLNQYAGTWYAIAHIPTRFESQCAAGTTATYTLLDNGKIRVENTCYTSSGTLQSVIGRAWVPNAAQPGRIKVSFVRFFSLWLFPGDYWILYIDSDYTTALVGHPRRQFGWILSRTPTLSDTVLDQLFARFEQAGYSRSDFVLIDQSVHATS
jgi:apolipoprotein D and lipocalin family protein